MTEQPDPPADDLDPDADPENMNPRSTLGQSGGDEGGDPDADPGNLNPREGGQAR